MAQIFKNRELEALDMVEKLSTIGKFKDKTKIFNSIMKMSEDKFITLNHLLSLLEERKASKRNDVKNIRYADIKKNIKRADSGQFVVPRGDMLGKDMLFEELKSIFDDDYSI